MKLKKYLPTPVVKSITDTPEGWQYNYFTYKELVDYLDKEHGDWRSEDWAKFYFSEENFTHNETMGRSKKRYGAWSTREQEVLKHVIEVLRGTSYTYVSSSMIMRMFREQGIVSTSPTMLKRVLNKYLDSIPEELRNKLNESVTLRSIKRSTDVSIPVSAFYYLEDLLN